MARSYSGHRGPQASKPIWTPGKPYCSSIPGQSDPAHFCGSSKSSGSTGGTTRIGSGKEFMWYLVHFTTLGTPHRAIGSDIQNHNQKPQRKPPQLKPEPQPEPQPQPQKTSA